MSTAHPASFDLKNAYMSTLRSTKVLSKVDYSDQITQQQIPPSSPILLKQPKQNPKFSKVINNFLVKNKFFDSLESCYKMKTIRNPSSQFDASNTSATTSQKNSVFQLTQAEAGQKNVSGRSTAMTSSFFESKGPIKSYLASPNKDLVSKSSKKQNAHDEDATLTSKPQKLEILNYFEQFHSKQQLGSQKNISQPNSSQKRGKANSRSQFNVTEFLPTQNPRLAICSESEKEQKSEYNNLISNKKSSSLFDILSAVKPSTPNDQIRQSHNTSHTNSLLLHNLQAYQDSTKQNTSIFYRPDSQSSHLKVPNKQINATSLKSDSLKNPENNSNNNMIQSMNKSSGTVVLGPILPQKSSKSQTKHNQSLDEKHVLQSKIFQEMHFDSKHVSHLHTLKKLPNQVQLMHDELGKLTFLPPQSYSGLNQYEIREHHQNTLSQPILSKHESFYNSVCGYVNDFSNSIVEKKPIVIPFGTAPIGAAQMGFDFRSSLLFSSDQAATNNKKSRNSSQIIRASVRANGGNNNNNNNKNSSENISQMEQYKAQMIESLLMNLTENFAFIVKMKKTSKSIMKALEKIQGFSDMRDTVFEEGAQKMKKQYDFRQGFIQETQKIIYWKNLTKQNHEESQKIPIQTSSGVELIPVDEAWQVYQAFQYFNQNLYEYIQDKLQMSERQKRGGLEKYMADIQEMKASQIEKPLVSRKDINEFLKIEKKFNTELQSGIFSKRGKIVKRMEEYEIHKGPFPFIGQLVRLKSQQIDQAQDVLKDQPIQ